MIHYQLESNLSAQEFKEVLIQSSLAERRPIGDLERLEAMVRHANLILTAREGHKLVGVARALTDFTYCTYLSDLAVDQAYQKQGIGKELIRRTKLEAPQATLILLAAPKAVDYYPHIGMTQHEACFLLRELQDLVP
ncbi:MAG TPA: GNAT family N-acetyltransferase [Flavobacteriaceae bacterium]|nr:GNAT family N-acetyltransferase [Flavobacteriaceae bacterium]HPF12044.1 GNAT family N-acetyltransferase [Flavobacteriaceae bacterium]HQU21312.1 GNAT family N-acetyltransferase [Flavobacteriaceae bacterium]HQU66521.1 GNAT family N-acetyltransferase [Flavobacteriaceae bacterium]HRW45272.1 GNAT family N-acetyltransferase [Flavobacteriaceae bacterium]